MCIYKQKMNEKTTYLNYFLNYLKLKLDIEKLFVKPTTHIYISPRNEPS